MALFGHRHEGPEVTEFHADIQNISQETKIDWTEIYHGSNTNIQDIVRAKVLLDLIKNAGVDFIPSVGGEDAHG